MWNYSPTLTNLCVNGNIELVVNLKNNYQLWIVAAFHTFFSQYAISIKMNSRLSVGLEIFILISGSLVKI